MMLTEQEAFLRWCPMGRMEQKRQIEENIMIPCLGQQCMAWRWLDIETAPDRRGWCGMAGDRIQWGAS